MIVNCDAKSLELNVCAYLSQDPTMIDEIINKKDLHEDNRVRFNLLTRLVAKIFVFRLIYGGTAYSYSVDPAFTDVSSSANFWQKVIDAFYEKYKGVARWHEEIIRTATTEKRLVMPTGRIYEFEPKVNYKGELQWPVTTIKNYPVQGTGADIMAIARVDFARRFIREQIDGVLVSTVHDSIVVDVKKKEVDKVVQMFYSVFEDIPSNFEKLFKVRYNLPVFAEIGIGPNMKELKIV